MAIAALDIRGAKVLVVLMPKVCSISIREAVSRLVPNTWGDYQHDFRRARWPNYTRIAFVRNPWDRLVGAWADKIRKRYDQDDPQMFSGFVRYGWPMDMEFAQFAEAACSMPDEQRNCHFSLQVPLLTQADEWCVDFLGRFERIAADWNRLRAMFPKLGELPHAHSSEHEPYTAYYTPELRKLVRKAYALDITRFGYTFGGK